MHTFDLSRRHRAVATVAVLLSVLCSSGAQPAPASNMLRHFPRGHFTNSRNSWRGITPLRSSAEDVALVMGAETEAMNGPLSRSFTVDEGEVTFSYLTTSLAKIYRAPSSMVGKVFTIQIRLKTPIPRTELKLDRTFKRCVTELSKSFYYLVSDTGLAYEINSRTEEVETIIYQPSRREIRRLAVSADCVF